MKLSSILAVAMSFAVPQLTAAVVLPNADTPLFHLVASSSSSTNLLAVRLQSGTGYPGGEATLLGGGQPAKFYFRQGQLVVHYPGIDPRLGPSYLRPYVNSIQDGAGCPNFGSFGFVQSVSSNKCTKYSTFQILSNDENSQLGSELVFNYKGGFYSCSGGQQIYYKDTPSRPPNNCERVRLWTVAASSA
ncbi:hypothetical protein CVT24_001811 [Panaeolus cyanescens]|uniref:Ubiquitin 3 binding protein But2 C-terminal domain-containing protein n=1 Tax=Panaeolus cyanescens TaxID=181874 RepID=A0A409YFK0_9AGAR|nr:hypothetical protein CVT24_001811 [Panaeolus cyanescens]